MSHGQTRCWPSRQIALTVGSVAVAAALGSASANPVTGFINCSFDHEAVEYDYDPMEGSTSASAEVGGIPLADESEGDTIQASHYHYSTTWYEYNGSECVEWKNAYRHGGDYSVSSDHGHYSCAFEDAGEATGGHEGQVAGDGPASWTFYGGVTVSGQSVRGCNHNDPGHGATDIAALWSGGFDEIDVGSCMPEPDPCQEVQRRIDELLGINLNGRLTLDGSFFT